VLRKVTSEEKFVDFANLLFVLFHLTYTKVNHTNLLISFVAQEKS